MQHALRSLALLALFLFVAGSARAGNWPQWRGPDGNSVSTETGLPTAWSETAGLAWKAALPEWGTSTPAVWEDAVFLTTQADDRLLLLRLDAANGETVWTRQVGSGKAARKTPEAANRSAKFHDLHNLASPSPVSDGERVIVHFGNGDLASYTFDGTQEWKRNLADDFGPYTIWWGHANSPVLFDDLVISVCMQDSLAGVADKLSPSYVVAHDKRTGEVVWHQARMTGAEAEQCDAYTTPVFVDSGRGTAMALMGGNQLDAYDPATGEQLWSLPGLVGGRTITGPTAADGLLYTTVGMRGPLQAINLAGRGERTAGEAVVWQETKSTPDTCCPVVAGGLLFIVTDDGVATCFDAKTGDQHWRERLNGRNYKSSPLIADGHVYFLGREGHCTVIKAAPKFELVAENKLDDEFLASPAVSNRRIYLRGRSALYAIGK